MEWETVQMAMETLNPVSIIINTSEFIIQQLYRGLESPASMAILAPNDILVLGKNNGTVRRIASPIFSLQKWHITKDPTV